MLNADMNTLAHNAATNLLIQLHTQGALGDVPYDTSLTVVELVGHTLVDSTITDDIDNLPELIVCQVLLEPNGTIATKRFLEQVASASSVAEGVRHAPCI